LRPGIDDAHRARMRRLALVLMLPACLASDAIEDGADDMVGDGKADGYGLSDAEVTGVLEVANTLTKAKLADDVGLSARVATNITNHRAGADNKLGTSDDDNFDDLAELDDIPYVGKRVFAALVDYARANGYVHDDDLSGFCKTEHAGTTPSGAKVATCDALFDAAPFIHLPADGAKTYGAILNGLGLTLYTGDGRALPLVNASGQTYAISHGPSGFKAPENLFAIYEVTGSPTTVMGEPALAVTSLRPVAWVPGSVQDARLLGTWEAVAAGRVGSNRFDETKPVRFRFTLTSKTDDTALWKNFGGGDGFVATGQIDNMTTAVTAADGTTLPSLASLGAGSPFYQPIDRRITLWRHPNMHGLNDQVLVMDYPTSSVDLSPNGMGYIGPFTVAGLIAAAGPSYGDTQIRPHATPNGAKIWGLTKVTQ
jgi:hypothetical protein